MRPLQTGADGRQTGRLPRPEGLRGGRERPPYNAAYTVVFSANPTRGTPLPGGIYASPTNKGTAYTNQKRHHRANGRGGRERPPYNAAYTVVFPANPTRGSRFAARFPLF